MMRRFLVPVLALVMSAGCFTTAPAYNPSPGGSVQPDQQAPPPGYQSSQPPAAAPAPSPRPPAGGNMGGVTKRSDIKIQLEVTLIPNTDPPRVFLEGQELSLSQLDARLRAELQSGGEVSISLLATKDAPYASVTAVVDLVKGAGVSKLAIGVAPVVAGPSVSVAPTPEPAPSAGAQAPMPIQPNPKPAPQSGMLDQFSFTKSIRWTVAGNTPLLAWSPDRAQIAVLSDLPQKGGIQDGKKYFDLVTAATGKVKRVATITSTGYEPIWLGSSAIVYECRKDRCGEEKNGLYLQKISGGAPKLIIPSDPKGYFSYYANSDGALLVRKTSYGLTPPGGEYVPPVDSWYELDPKTYSATTRTDFSPSTPMPPTGYAYPESCVGAFPGTRIYAQAVDGKISLMDADTRQTRTLFEVPPWPYYPGDTYGLSPCFSPDKKKLAYFSYDDAKKAGYVYLLNVETAPSTSTERRSDGSPF